MSWGPVSGDRQYSSKNINLAFVLYGSFIVYLFYWHCFVGWISVPVLEACLWPIQGLGGAGLGGPGLPGGTELLWGRELGEVLQGRQGTRQGGRETTKWGPPVSKGVGLCTTMPLCVSYTLFFWLLVVPDAHCWSHCCSHYSTTSLLHYSTTPLLHYSTTPLLHYTCMTL